MKIEERIEELNSALSTIDGLLLDAENPVEVKVYSHLYEKVNAVYISLCHERAGIEEKE